VKRDLAAEPKESRKRRSKAAGSVTERIVLKNYWLTSHLKSYAYVESSVILILRTQATEEEKRSLSIDAADVYANGRRHANETIPAHAVPLGHFDGRPVLGRLMVEFVEARLRRAGLVPEGKHVYIIAKCELKRVTYDPRTGWSSKNQTVFGGEWAESILEAGGDPNACVATPPHRDSGPQHLNMAFETDANSGEVVVNTDPSAIQVDYRAVMPVGGDNLLMLLKTPRHDAEGNHDGWQIRRDMLSMGDIYLFRENAGVFNPHAAAIAPGGCGCSAYVVVDIQLSTTAPGDPFASPPPTSTLACQIMSPTFFPDAEAPSTKFWSTIRTERAAASYLPHEQQREVCALAVAIAAARRQEQVTPTPNLYPNPNTHPNPQPNPDLTLRSR